MLDLQEDPSEMHNLTGTPALAAALNDHRKRPRTWSEETRAAEILPRLVEGKGQ